MDVAITETMVQVPGSALKVGRAFLRRELERDRDLRRMMERYWRFAFGQLAQTAACNRLHSQDEPPVRPLGRSGRLIVAPPAATRAMFEIEQTHPVTASRLSAPTRRFDRDARRYRRAFRRIGVSPAGAMAYGGGGDGEPGNLRAKVWLHTQNIQRYRMLLRNPAHSESHDRIRKLLDEEEDGLRFLDPKYPSAR